MPNSVLIGLDKVAAHVVNTICKDSIRRVMFAGLSPAKIQLILSAARKLKGTFQYPSMCACIACVYSVLTCMLGRLDNAIRVMFIRDVESNLICRRRHHVSDGSRVCDEEPQEVGDA